MIIQWLLAAIHLSAFGLALAASATRNRAFKRVAAAPVVQVADLKAVFRADTGWGLTALVLLVTGLMRAFGGFEKGSAYYLHEPLFHLKMTAFVIILILEIRPMGALLRWRAAVRRGELPDVARAFTYSRICHAQAALIILIVFAAAGMARGIGAG
ncbi:DUF2214 family protein [Burkholderia glumae]|uniref:DUF2214 family protein n=1 Tax=Burkholderia glumae TaxID=337 RepID=UPI0003A9123D|nr:DUF2214 family protein [Burkholderia glumae]MCM2492467.1 DUF2214 family protein [Burkholderia glumae]MCM2543465.1 DUF2214 family protein [Burkholderia glumae]MCM2550256.1 DUF2214 family protein [Burkholderia glumae]NVE22191.1 DUF2214 family protein [Burkholderia glumae]QGA38391.1 DUF2214 family protein [Burkholderia glumae]